MFCFVLTSLCWSWLVLTCRLETSLRKEERVLSMDCFRYQTNTCFFVCLCPFGRTKVQFTKCPWRFLWFDPPCQSLDRTAVSLWRCLRWLTCSKWVSHRKKIKIRTLVSDRSDIVIRTQGFISSVTRTAADIWAITWGWAFFLRVICEQQQWTPLWRGSTKDLDTTTTLQSVRKQSPGRWRDLACNKC